MADKISPLPGNRLRIVESWDDYGEISEARPATGSIEKATVITSEVVGSKKHRPVIDIDHVVKVIESSTPGHSHLYIDKKMSWKDFQKLLRVMVEVGLVEEGYLGASLERGHTALRLPWIKKEEVVVHQKGWPLPEDREGSDE